MGKYLSFLTFFLLLTVGVFAQSSISIKPKKVVYTRSGAEPEKRHFDIRYPIVTGLLSPTVKRKLENTISYWRVFETSLKESMEETYLSSLDYQVNYNKNGVLDISLIQEGVGAYPSTQTVNLLINLKTGRQVEFKDVFKSGQIDNLAKMVDRRLEAEKRKIKQQIDRDVSAGNEAETDKTSFKEDVENLKFTTKDFNEFSVSDKGVTILYDAGFPHVILALQPEGRYFFTYSELKPFIRSDGLLGKFIR